MTRRDSVTLLGGAALSRVFAQNRQKIAVVTTAYRENSHADVIAGRLIAGYEFNGRPRKPAVDVVSMYTDQVPANDMSRALASQYGFRIFPTVREALCLGGRTLAVDGVAFIGEHGEYPFNEKGQHLYSRYELYKQIVDVFRESGRVVPVYCDKHFSYDWEKAKWMYDQSREMHFPLMAGSSVPLTWRRPSLELDLSSPVEKAVMVAYGGNEVYGFHALEGLECMLERRKGFETGVAAVQCLQGGEVWKWNHENDWADRLMREAVGRCEPSKTGSLEDNVKSPALFVVEYRSGLRGAVYMLDGQINQFAFAAMVARQSKPVSTEMWLQPVRYYNHFSPLVYYMEQMFITGRTAYPVERTLLTTGTLAALMDSCYEHRRIETPHLNITYRPASVSLYNRGPVPAPLPEGGSKA